jgi:hypothetical protein
MLLTFINMIDFIFTHRRIIFYTIMIIIIMGVLIWMI